MKKKIFSVFMVLLMTMMSVNTFAATISDNQLEIELKSSATIALQLINELVALSMEREIHESDNRTVVDSNTNFCFNIEALNAIDIRVNEINQLLDELNVVRLEHDEISSFIGGDIPDYDIRTSFIEDSILDNSIDNLPPWPNPGSNNRIQFYGVFDWASNGQQIWLLIAAPIVNSSHSANQNVHATNLQNRLTDGARTLIGIYADRAFGNIMSNIPFVRWLPYELLPGFLTPQTTQAQIPLYEARLITRTVTQFIYFRNPAGQPVYYGSTNFVHAQTEQIFRSFASNGQLETRAVNTPIEGIPAIDYFDFGRIVVNANLSAWGVQLRHSFVNRVTMRANNNITLTINPRTFTLPIHAVN